jgi:hypothetical protein
VIIIFYESIISEPYTFRRSPISAIVLYITPLVFLPTSMVICTEHSDFFFHWRYSPNLGLGLPPWKYPFHFGFLDLRYSVGLLGRVISSSQGLSTCTQTQKNAHTHRDTKHPCLVWDSNPRSRLPSERRQYILDRSATVTGEDSDSGDVFRTLLFVYQDACSYSWCISFCYTSVSLLHVIF